MICPLCRCKFVTHHLRSSLLASERVIHCSQFSPLCFRQCLCSSPVCIRLSSAPVILMTIKPTQEATVLLILAFLYCSRSLQALTSFCSLSLVSLTLISFNWPQSPNMWVLVLVQTGIFHHEWRTLKNQMSKCQWHMQWPVPCSPITGYYL